MDTMYDILFNTLGFNKVRNKIFDSFVKNVENFIKKNKFINLNDLKSKLEKCISEKNFPSFQIKNFVFIKSLDCFIFYHENYPKYRYNFVNLKKFDIYRENLRQKNKEWVFCEDYLNYIIYKVYKLKNPRYGSSIKKVKEDESICSLDNDTLKDLMINDSNIIYEPKINFEFDEILEIKEMKIEEKLNNEFFLEIIGLKGVENLSPLNSFSFNDLFAQYKNLDEKTLIFHNDDKNFRLNIIKNLDYHYSWANLGYFFINFELFRKGSRDERFKRLLYFIASLFPPKYEYLKTFYEGELKNLLTKQLSCWPEIINKIINYFNKNVFKNLNKNQNKKTIQKDDDDDEEEKGEVKEEEDIIKDEKVENEEEEDEEGKDIIKDEKVENEEEEDEEGKDIIKEEKVENEEEEKDNDEAKDVIEEEKVENEEEEDVIEEEKVENEEEEDEDEEGKDVIKEEKVENEEEEKDNEEAKDEIKEEKVENEDENEGNEENEIDLFKNIDQKKFIIIFDNIQNEKENKIVEQIINKHSNSKFKFVICYPLVNQFTFRIFINSIFTPYDSFSPFSIYFDNLKDNKQDNEEKQIMESNVIANLKKIKYDDEETFYDLLRIFNFKKLFVDSIDYDINSKSLIFLQDYIKYLNIKFDNKNKKIIDISFKNKNEENEFYQLYDGFSTEINMKNNLLFENISKQPEGINLEKIIILNIIEKNIEEFETLQLKSIFGLREIKKKEGINYESSNFFLKQTSLGGELFDFGFKIQKNLKQYLKLTQITFDKNFEDLNKLSIEKLIIHCSYLKKLIKENNLGNIDGISFSIIAPSRILKNEKMYTIFEKFCEINKYEFILFDLNKKTFYKKEEGKNKSYNKKLFEINKDYLLDVPDFEDIIKINKNLLILSTRNVKERDEISEDSKAKEIAKNYITKEEIIRVAKFQFGGNFSDIKSLEKDYFGYIYSKDKKSAYFYDENIINRNFKPNKKSFKETLTLILYSKEKVNHNLKELVSEENDKKTKKNKKAKPELIQLNASIELEEEEEEEEKEKKNEKKVKERKKGKNEKEKKKGVKKGKQDIKHSNIMPKKKQNKKKMTKEIAGIKIKLLSKKTKRK